MGAHSCSHLRQVCWKPDGSGIDGMDFGWDAILYDWIHDALTPEERTLLREPDRAVPAPLHQGTRDHAGGRNLLV